MANNKMLIDAGHPEETRVVVVRGNRVEEFDFESEDRRQLRGNIYLAKVTRVEPSLQAAFVDYGGNRHGFLAFSEIHPDYYQIPVADRQALIEEEQRQDAAEADESADESDEADAAGSDSEGADTGDIATVNGAAAEAAPAPSVSESAPETETEDAETTDAGSDEAQPDDATTASPENDTADSDDAVAAATDDQGDESGDDEDTDESLEAIGSGDALEEVPVRRKPRARHYKIQEVIKRRQIMLVQVVKEERGNKGAALTTYLSLAGRYAVLMPNTARGGGISRKITSLADRKRLKQVVSDLDMPEGMGVILRTAGAARTKVEVKRDFEYLLRLWENVRELTLKSSAPTMVYEEGSLIKRSIRDLYNKDIDEIVVAGEAAHREAKDFMRMLMPSHARNVKFYAEAQPLLAGSGIETQLDAMFLPQVTLKSGGYIVINQTEALVSIDVNSGRSTREHNIEDTALQTNLEASDEVARQLRLRDLAGLIVIDFIDMDEKRNNRAVERRLKEALKNDRARIQVGRISPFGLMEMSRQRLRTGVLESTTTICTACHGNGYVRAPASVALHVLRSLEDHLLKNSSHDVTVRTSTDVALYVLNNKRAHLGELEDRFGLDITFAADDAIADGAHFAIERGARAGRRPARTETIQPDSVAPLVEIEDDIPIGDEADEEVAILEEVNGEAQAEGVQTEEASTSGRRRRRRRRRGGNGQQGEAAAPDTSETSDSDDDGEKPAEVAADGEDDQDERPKRRRRGRRGGRRNRRSNGDSAVSENGAASGEATVAFDDDATPETVGEARDNFLVAEGTNPQAPGETAASDNDASEASTADSLVDAVADAILPEPEEASADEAPETVEAPAPAETESPALAAEEPPPLAEPTVAETSFAESPAAEAPVEVNGHGHTPAEETPQAEPAPPQEAAAVEVTPAASEESPPEDKPDEPKRRGWWQRRSFF